MVSDSNLIGSEVGLKFFLFARQSCKILSDIFGSVSGLVGDVFPSAVKLAVYINSGRLYTRRYKTQYLSVTLVISHFFCLLTTFLSSVLIDLTVNITEHKDVLCNSTNLSNSRSAASTIRFKQVITKFHNVLFTTAQYREHQYCAVAATV